MKIITGNANKPLAEDIASFLDTEMTQCAVKRFNDKEIFVEIFENVRGEDVFAIQPTSYPANDNLLELLIMIDALKRASARRITTVIPYFGYARQDRKSGSRTPISAKLVANLITTAGANRIMTIDLHAGQIQGFFDIPADNLSCRPVFLKDIREKHNIDNVVIVSPDVGGVVRARSIAKKLEVPLAIIDKRRDNPGESEVMNIIGDVAGKTCIIIDDIVDSGGTLCSAAYALKEKGATEVKAYISHGVLPADSYKKIDESCLEELVISDSIEPKQEILQSKKIRILSIAPLIARAIKRTNSEESVSSLFL